MTVDLFEVLSAADPARDVIIPARSIDDLDLDLDLDFDLRTEPTPRRPRRRLVRAALAATAVALAAFAWVATRPVTDPTVINCFAAPSLDASMTVVPASGADPIEACLELWVDGAVTDDLEVDAPDDLTACILRGGQIGVFPLLANRACASLDLPEADSTRDDLNRQVVELARSLGERLNPQTCVGETEARRMAAEEVDALGLAFSVRLREPFTEQKPCATAAIDAEQALVLLVPTVRAGP